MPSQYNEILVAMCIWTSSKSQKACSLSAAIETTSVLTDGTFLKKPDIRNIWLIDAPGGSEEQKQHNLRGSFHFYYMISVCFILIIDFSLTRNIKYQRGDS